MKKDMYFQILCRVFAIAIAVGIYGCRDKSDIMERVDVAESLIESHPDSSLRILNHINCSDLKDIKERARYSLLKSMALDKNFIDVTTFEVIQPALDYYLEHGNADERQKTLYYKGRIHRNAGDDDRAMQSYMSALELSDEISDSLTLARLLVAQGTLFYKQYRIEDFIYNNIKAAEIYGQLGNTRQQLKSYSKALDGETRRKNKLRADSLAFICRTIKNDKTADPQVKQALFEYVISFGSIQETSEMIREVQQSEEADYMRMNLARAFLKIGDAETGLRYLEDVKIKPDNIFDSLSYWSVKTNIHEKLEEPWSALEAYRNYSSLLETYHTTLFSNELLFSEKKHIMEMENMSSLRKRDNTIKWILAGAGCLLLITVVTYYRYRMNKAARQLAESNAEKLQLESEKQRLLAEKLESERARLSLEAENLHLQIVQIEREREQLRELLDRQETLSEEARVIIKERISMLNGLFAQYLTDQESYGKEFMKYVRRIRKDKKGFQESIEKVLDATHPEFMQYLRERNLNERELHYACLYAIGMRGKEIGTYLDLTRHYNISSEIRRKLGLDNRGENLGPYLRKLMGSED